MSAFFPRLSSPRLLLISKMKHHTNVPRRETAARKLVDCPVGVYSVAIGNPITGHRAGGGRQASAGGVGMGAADTEAGAVAARAADAANVASDAVAKRELSFAKITCGTGAFVFFGQSSSGARLPTRRCSKHS